MLNVSKPLLACVAALVCVSRVRCSYGLYYHIYVSIFRKEGLQEVDENNFPPIARLSGDGSTFHPVCCFTHCNTPTVPVWMGFSFACHFDFIH